MLTAIAFFLMAVGSTSFAAIKDAFASNSSDAFLLKLGTGLFLCGLLIKCGVVPFHLWVPDAYSAAPASVSVLLAGVVTKVSGVYVLLRLFGTVFILNAALQNTLLLVGIISICFAAFASLTQTDFKRMLAYSSISQVGYIVLALGAATPLAFVGAVFHFFNHAIFKSLLFVNAASLEKRLGTTDMDKIGGMGSKMKVTSATSLIGLLSTAGIPPLSGFWSKLIIIIALFSAGRPVYAVIALLASALTLAYFLSLERKVFFGKVVASPAAETKASFGITFSEVLLAAITVAAGLGFAFILNTWLLPLKEIVH
jgi:multicomponent Na+:H+ antiporter subunit D